MIKRKTAGELSLKASSDTTKYDPLELGYELCDDVVKQIYICAQNHEHIFDEEEFFIGLFIAGDPLIHNVRRHKYAAFLYLPSPRPNQSCYLYNKKTQKIKRLWSLPSALVMAKLSEMPYVHLRWQMTKSWCDAFFNKCFWECIRSQNGFNHLSEHEYLKANREEFIKAGSNEGQAPLPDSFDFSKIGVNQVVSSNNAVVNE